MFVPCMELNCWHYATALCAGWEKQKHRRIVEQEAREEYALAFKVYDQTLDMVYLLQYLG